MYYYIVERWAVHWQHVVNLYEQDKGKASGLSLVPKLKFEHIHLSSFSKMRVDLAAQVSYMQRESLRWGLVGVQVIVSLTLSLSTF